MRTIQPDKARLIEHLRHLVSFQTTDNRPDEIERCFAYVQAQLATTGLTVKTFHVPRASDSRATVQSQVWSQAGRQDVDIMLYAHLDVVSASESLFDLQINDNIARGRGVFDMKFALALYIEIIRALADQGHNLSPLALCIVSDEEVGGTHGVRYLLEQEHYHSNVVFMPDGGANWHIVEEAKGLLHVSVSATGKSAHASRPWYGESAIDHIIEIASRLRSQYPLQTGDTWKTTVTYTEIDGGRQTDKNQVANQASLYLDIRFPKEEGADHLLDTITRVCASVTPQASVTTLVRKDAFQVERGNRYIDNWRRLIADKATGDVFIHENGTADHHYFSSHGIPVLVSSPVGGDIHSETEWIDLDSLVEFGERLARFIIQASQLK
ncbi:MAG: M20/M25/M40 family metallo-hydrolase [Anaerolineae bacterium]|nr:M20/M25/M40 family metallo-hydrolase [Anaerolineae bacterium]